MGVAYCVSLAVLGIVFVRTAKTYNVHFVLAVCLALVVAVGVIERLVVTALVVVFGFNDSRNVGGNAVVGGLRNGCFFASHVPVVKIETSLLDHKEQVIDADSIG